MTYVTGRDVCWPSQEHLWLMTHVLTQVHSQSCRILCRKGCIEVQSFLVHGNDVEKDWCHRCHWFHLQLLFMFPFSLQSCFCLFCMRQFLLFRIFFLTARALFVNQRANDMEKLFQRSRLRGIFQNLWVWMMSSIAVSTGCSPWTGTDEGAKKLLAQK